MDKEVKLSDIFMGYRGKIRQIISRIVKRDDIDDLIQETFLRTYQADLKKEIKYVRSYMLTTAKNLALNHIAKWDNKFNDSLEDFTESPVELKSCSFEENFESKERFLFFCRAIEQLPNSVRKCFVLKKVYGFSQKEIAQYLQLSESTVEKHIAKGLLKSVQIMEQMEHVRGRNPVEKDSYISSKGKKKRVIK
ncbi:RNA polymerase sigma factor [Thalassotalea fonticola]|uniref:RNA polymerase sigma factor n=1 Tax=Thalassotalea fonticola TaxID=3065649 RepID=A0ABZ0GKW2_9GAMM|nr:RNA polymerase sigma factor [Colwelliaceae bacterium S1-1]